MYDFHIIFPLIFSKSLFYCLDRIKVFLNYVYKNFSLSFLGGCENIKEYSTSAWTNIIKNNFLVLGKSFKCFLKSSLILIIFLFIIFKNFIGSWLKIVSIRLKRILKKVLKIYSLFIASEFLLKIKFTFCANFLNENKTYLKYSCGFLVWSWVCVD